MTASEQLARHHEALLSMVGEPPPIPGGFAVKCPVCGDHSPPDWIWYETRRAGEREEFLLAKGRGEINLGTSHAVGVCWMRCANEACEELIIQIAERRIEQRMVGGAPIIGTDTWIVRPRFGNVTRPIDPLVKDPYRRDYQEATAILDISPRMSAVLSRKIMGDLLEDYAGKKAKRITAQIDAFNAETWRPLELRRNLHHWREVADFAAHTQKDEQGAVIDVDRDEASWTLDLVDELFTHLIIAPDRSQKMRAGMDEKIERAGRKPIKPLLDDVEPAGDS